MDYPRIVTDSTAELPADLAEALNITVVPWRVQVNGSTLVDTPALRTPDFYRKTLQGKKTLEAIPPTPAQFAEAFARCTRTTNQIIVILPSSKLTRSIEIARRARAEFVGRCDIHIIDSQFISCALGALVVEAARGALAHLDAEEIIRQVHGMALRTYLAFHVDSPEQLLKHSLIRNTSEMLGSPSGYRPLLLLEEGEITALQRSRKRGEPIERLVEFVAEFVSLERLWIWSTGVHPALEPFKQLLIEMLPNRPFEDHIYGPVVADYFGMSALGVVAIEAPF